VLEGWTSLTESSDCPQELQLVVNEDHGDIGLDSSRGLLMYLVVPVWLASVRGQYRRASWPCTTSRNSPPNCYVQELTWNSVYRSVMLVTCPLEASVLACRPQVCLAGISRTSHEIVQLA
jgi:hypothetical protein